jgi:hypothetical protein
MDNWLANIVGDVDNLHVEIDNLNDPLVGFCFIRSVDFSEDLIVILEFAFSYLCSQNMGMLKKQKIFR